MHPSFSQLRNTQSAWLSCFTHHGTGGGGDDGGGGGGGVKAAVCSRPFFRYNIVLRGTIKETDTCILFELPGEVRKKNHLQ